MPLRLHTLLLGAALIAGVACSTPTEPVDFSEPATSPAAIVRVTNQYVGDQRVFDSLRVDSASGIWHRTRCGPVSAALADCGSSTVMRDSGVVNGALRASLFARMRQPAFLALAAEYRRTGVTPADRAAERLDVIQNGRRKAIDWESGAEVPTPVTSIVCRLQAAQNPMILCYD